MRSLKQCPRVRRNVAGRPVPKKLNSGLMELVAAQVLTRDREVRAYTSGPTCRPQRATTRKAPTPARRRAQTPEAVADDGPAAYGRRRGWVRAWRAASTSRPAPAGNSPGDVALHTAELPTVETTHCPWSHASVL